MLSMWRNKHVNLENLVHFLSILLLLSVEDYCLLPDFIDSDQLRIDTGGCSVYYTTPVFRWLYNYSHTLRFNFLFLLDIEYMYSIR